MSQKQGVTNLFRRCNESVTEKAQRWYIDFTGKVERF